MRKRWYWLETPFGQEFLVYMDGFGRSFAHGEMYRGIFLQYDTAVKMREADYLADDKISIMI